MFMVCTLTSGFGARAAAADQDGATGRAGAAYLAALNAEQRRAVEHSCDDLAEAPPVLIIAGSGKTMLVTSRAGQRPRRSAASNAL
jgi:hypothetical protein